MERVDLSATGDAPWQFEKGILSPLLEEYDSVIAELKSQNSKYKAEHEKLKKELSTLIIENGELSRQLKECVSGKLELGVPISPRHRKDADLVANLQKQLEMTSQEKDAAVSMWQMALQQVDHLEDELRELRNDDQMEITTKAVEQVKLEYSAAIHMLEKILEKERSTRKEFEAKVGQLNSTNQTLKNRLSVVEVELKVRKAESERMAALEKCVAELRQETVALRRENVALEKEADDVRLQVDELLVREAAARERVKESVEIIESALFEKEQALVREREARGEIENLRQAIDDLIKEASSKAKQEVDILRRQYNRNIESLLEKIRILEEECSEKQIQLELAVEEQRLVKDRMEALLSKAQKNEVVSSANSCSLKERRVHSLLEKLTQSESELYSERLRKQRLQKELEQCRENLEQECESRKSLSDHMDKQLNLLTAEVQDAHHMRVVLVAEMEDLKRELVKKEEGISVIQEQLKKEMVLKEQKHRLQENQLAARIQAIDEANLAAVGELQKLLVSQRSIGNRWQDEVQKIVSGFEDRLQELRMRCKRLQHEREDWKGQAKSLAREVRILEKQTRSASSDEESSVNSNTAS